MGNWGGDLGFVHQRAGNDVHNTSIAASAFIRLWPQTPWRDDPVAAAGAALQTWMKMKEHLKNHGGKDSREVREKKAEGGEQTDDDVKMSFYLFGKKKKPEKEKPQKT